MRKFGAIIFAMWSSWLCSGPALAEKRVALVIGNSAYENVGRLSNPANDADAMTTTLKEAGFDVVDSRRNLKIADMRRAFRDFADKSRDADFAVVYYAGHGMEVDGTNYIIPVDATLERDLDVYDEAFPLDRILISIEPAKQLRLVILDACRDNPFAKTMKRTIGSRAVGRGLAKVEPASPNTLIAFASKAGSTASDGDSKNSPFTLALIKHITTPGLDLRKAFGYVRDDVLKNTSNRQEPYVYGSLGGADVPLVPAKPFVAVPAANPNADTRRDYELALQIGTKEVWAAFLSQYPEGLYASLAKGQLNKIASEEARIAATESARHAEEEKARLAGEGAKKAEQAKADAKARDAEQARIVAEKSKQLEQAKVAAAEQARVAGEKAAAEKATAVNAAATQATELHIAAEKTAAEKLGTDKQNVDRPVAEKATPGASPVEPEPSQRVASLPPEPPSVKSGLSPEEITRLTQVELRRVGCFVGTANGEWNTASRRSLELFNKRAGTKLDVKIASLDSIDAIKARPARVCPLICDHGFKADGDRCSRISCKAGYYVNTDDECEKELEKPREKPTLRSNPDQSDKVSSSPSKPQAATGEILCNNQGCRPVQKGCHLSRANIRSDAANGTREVCN